MKRVIAILFFLFAGGLIIFAAVYPSIKNRERIAKITNFQECAAAGYPVMESYPRQCTLPGGHFFVEQVVLEK